MSDKCLLSKIEIAQISAQTQIICALWSLWFTLSCLLVQLSVGRVAHKTSRPTNLLPIGWPRFLPQQQLIEDKTSSKQIPSPHSADDHWMCGPGSNSRNFLLGKLWKFCPYFSRSGWPGHAGLVSEIVRFIGQCGSQQQFPGMVHKAWRSSKRKIRTFKDQFGLKFPELAVLRNSFYSETKRQVANYTNSSRFSIS